MDRSAFTGQSPGQLIEIGSGEIAFVPAPLRPGMAMPTTLWPLHSEAMTLLGRLRGLTDPGIVDPKVLLRPLQLREALRSSSQEGTHVEPEALIEYAEDPKEPRSEHDDRNSLREVWNLREALDAGETLWREQGFSAWVVRSLHQMLLRGVRGSDKQPGQFRLGQVFIGSDHRFVPPPGHLVPELIEELMGYVTAADTLPPLERAFAVHYQFETIHPFLDGNGRVGRLLLALMLGEESLLGRPWLYLSPYFERFRLEYVDGLLAVSTHGDWERWFALCLRSVIAQCRDAIARITRLIALHRSWTRLLTDHKLKASAFRMIEPLLASRMIPMAEAARIMDVTFVTAQRHVERLVQIGIATTTDRRPTLIYAPQARRIVTVDDAAELSAGHDDLP